MNANSYPQHVVNTTRKVFEEHKKVVLFFKEMGAIDIASAIEIYKELRELADYQLGTVQYSRRLKRDIDFQNLDEEIYTKVLSEITKVERDIKQQIPNLLQNTTKVETIIDYLSRLKH